MTFLEHADFSKSVKAENSNRGNFNFVAAGDWGCENECKENFHYDEKNGT